MVVFFRRGLVLDSGYAAWMLHHPIRAVSFDAGGTLLHPHPRVGMIYAEVMGRHGLNLSPDDLEAAFHRAWTKALQASRLGVSEESERDWWRAVVREVLQGLGEPTDFEALFEDLWVTFADPERWRLYGGALETLDALRRRGYRLLVVSNWDKRLRQLMAGLRVAPFLEHLVISSEVGFEKPDRRIFETAQTRLDLPSTEILHVGDSPYHDAEGAEAAGWQWVLIAGESAADGPRCHVKQLTELLGLLP